MTAGRTRRRRARGGAPAAARARPQPVAAEARSITQLRRKYADLCAKYGELVARTATAVTDRVGSVALALSAMRAIPSALALADRERVLFANPHWTQLTRANPALVRLAGSTLLPASGSAREVAETGTAAILAAKAPEVLTARYESGQGGWDLRFERATYRGGDAVMIVAADASAAIRADRELDRTRRSLAEQERLRTVGLLAAGIAHDFSNALNAAGMHVELLARAASADPGLRAHVAGLERVLRGMGERTRRLRALALERHELALERVELGPVVEAAVDLARAEFRSRDRGGVEIVVDSSVDALPAVRGAAAELVHVILNVLLNARDAMPKGGTIRITGAQHADAASLHVADEGEGIPQHLLTRVFEPFFTTKGDGGTGLGLATAYGLMRAIEGEISAANRPSGGAIISLRFRRWS